MELTYEQKAMQQGMLIEQRIQFLEKWEAETTDLTQKMFIRELILYYKKLHKYFI